MKKYLDFENLDFFLSNLDNKYCTKSEAGDISSGQVLNVTVNHTFNTYTSMEVETKRRRVYSDIPCTQSKPTMNAQVSPNDNVEDISLLTYAEPFEGYVRCYFSEQPTSPYTIDSVELTPVIESTKP